MSGVRHVPRAWYACCLVGIAIAGALGVAGSLLRRPLRLTALVCCVITLAAFGSALALRAWLRGRVPDGEDDASRKRWYLGHGYRFLAWFAAHSLLWVSLATVASVIALAHSIRDPMQLSLSAGLLACAAYSVLGLKWTRVPHTLGICWCEVERRHEGGYWESGEVALRLQRRFDDSRDRRDSDYRRLYGAWSEGATGGAPQERALLLVLGEEDALKAFGAEFGRRAVAFLVPFLAAFLAAFVLFLAARRPMDQVAWELNRLVPTNVASVVGVEGLSGEGTSEPGGGREGTSEPGAGGKGTSEPGGGGEGTSEPGAGGKRSESLSPTGDEIPPPGGAPPQLGPPQAMPESGQPGPAVPMTIQPMTAVGAEAGATDPSWWRGDTLPVGSPLLVFQRESSAPAMPRQWIPNWILNLLAGPN